MIYVANSAIEENPITRLSLLEIERAILNVFEGHECFDKIKVMIPKRQFGDLAANFPMIIGKALKTSPVAVFEQFKSKMEAVEYVVKVDFVAGFCNFWLSQEFFADTLTSILTLGPSFGATNIGQGAKVNIEYISANPTGNLHLGHLRGLYADALANVLNFLGYKVSREHYVNDLGNQVEILGRSVLFAISKQLGLASEKPKDCYQSEEVDSIANELLARRPERFHGNLSQVDAIFCGEYAIESMLRHIQSQLEYVGVRFDIWRRESDLYREGVISKAIAKLEQSGLIKTGVLGELAAKRGEASGEQIKIFKDCKAVTKANGTHSYFGADIGYLYDKINRGYERIIYCVGAEQAPNFELLQEVAKDFKYEGEVSVISFQTVNMLKDGQAIKFSKRGGIVVRPTDLNLPTPDLLRLLILSKRNDTHFSININELLDISPKNIFYFILEPVNRARSILNNQISDNGEINSATKTNDLSPDAIDLIHLLSQFPQKVIQAMHAINILVDYIIEIAGYLKKLLHENIINFDVLGAAIEIGDQLWALLGMTNKLSKH